jgi:hypothetical protein
MRATVVLSKLAFSNLPNRLYDSFGVVLAVQGTSVAQDRFFATINLLFSRNLDFTFIVFLITGIEIVWNSFWHKLTSHKIALNHRTHIGNTLFVLRYVLCFLDVYGSGT